MRIIDFDPEFTWDEDEPFPVALIERGRVHAWICPAALRFFAPSHAFVGTAARWHHVNDWRGISFVVLGCAICGQEIGRGIVWCTPSSDSVYPWQEGYWARVERGVA